MPFRSSRRKAEGLTLRRLSELCSLRRLLAPAGTPPEENLALARAARGDDAFDAAWAEGQALSRDVACELALHGNS